MNLVACAAAVETADYLCISLEIYCLQQLTTSISAKILWQLDLNLKILKRKLLAAGRQVLAGNTRGTEFF
jgi:hypothetical protein